MRPVLKIVQASSRLATQTRRGLRLVLRSANSVPHAHIHLIPTNSIGELNALLIMIEEDALDDPDQVWRQGDVIIGTDGTRFQNFGDVVGRLMSGGDKEIKCLVLRNGVEVDVMINARDMQRGGGEGVRIIPTHKK